MYHTLTVPVTAATGAAIYALSLHDALPISVGLGNRTLTNAGTAVWTGSGDITPAFAGYPGGVLDNLAGATFTVENDQSAGAVTVHNAGTLTKRGGTGTTTLGSLANSGTVEVQSGRLSTVSGGSSTGPFTVGAGAAEGGRAWGRGGGAAAAGAGTVRERA